MQLQYKMLDMDIEKKCEPESTITNEAANISFSSSFLTRLAQLQDDDDEEPVDNTQD
jgi:hypothetical protein